MALQSDISRSDGWFIGEDKRIRFTVYQTPQQAAVEDISGWTFAYEFYVGKDIAFTIATGPDLTVAVGTDGVAVVAVAGELTAGLSALTDLHYVFRRTDVGERAVVAYGDLILIDPAEV